MTAPVEVTVACPNRASHGPQCQQVGIPKDRRCGRCGGYYGEPMCGVSAVLVGRDALVMAWARAMLAYDAAWGRWNHGTRKLPVPSGAYDAELSALIEAEDALRTWDAGTEGGANGG